MLNRDRPWGSTGPNRSSASIIRVQTGLSVSYRARLFAPVQNGATPFVTLALPAQHRGLHCARYVMVETRWRHCHSQNEPVSPWHCSSLPKFSAFFQVTPVRHGCIKHFKTTGVTSRFIMVPSWFAKVLHGATMVVSRFITDHRTRMNRGRENAALGSPLGSPLYTLHYMYSEYPQHSSERYRTNGLLVYISVNIFG